MTGRAGVEPSSEQEAELMWSKFPLQQLQKKSRRLRHSQMDPCWNCFPDSAETPWKQNPSAWEWWCQSSPKAAGSVEGWNKANPVVNDQEKKGKKSALAVSVCTSWSKGCSSPAGMGPAALPAPEL